MRDTGIRWTNDTWNDLNGCDFFSVCCQNCYAAGLTARFNYPGGYGEGLAYFDEAGKAQWTGRVNMRWDKIDIPRRWKEPRLIFCNSMSDLFHRDVTDEFILANFKVMAECPRHTFQVLTKRSQRLAQFCHQYYPNGLPPNVWVGVSVGVQQDVNKAVDLATVAAAVRWLSCEPLVGSVVIPPETLRQLQWVVIGGESGPGARRMLPEWARGLRADCRAVGVPVFWKQWGIFGPDGKRHQGKHFEGFDRLDGERIMEYPVGFEASEELQEK